MLHQLNGPEQLLGHEKATPHPRQIGLDRPTRYGMSVGMMSKETVACYDVNLQCLFAEDADGGWTRLLPFQIDSAGLSGRELDVTKHEKEQRWSRMCEEKTEG